MRLHYYQKDKDTEPEGGLKLSTVKKLIKTQGGKGWTEHLERDGGCFEVTPIIANESNASTTYKANYNHHL